MKKNAAFFMFSLIAMLLFEPASASRCDAHFPFDGTLADATGNGYNGMMIAEGDAGEPQFGEGKYGQALHITGNAAMRAFLDLHHETCPQFTITAWFKLPSVEVGGPQAILSTGARGGIPVVVASGSTLMLYGKGNGLWQKDAIQDGNTWFFVAATFDYEAGTYKLYWRNRSQDGKLSETPYDAEDAFWIGARSDELRYMAQDLYVDEVRVYGRVLNLDQIRDVSRNVVAHDTAQTQTTVSAITDASSAVPVPFGNQAEIEIPEDAVRTRPPMGQLPAFPATSEADPTAWNNPEQQIADPNSQAVIFGTVTDTTGRGVPDTLVRVLRAANGKRIAKTRTGSDGRYEVAVFASEPVKVEFHNMLVFPHASIEYAGRTWSLDQASLIKIKPGQEVEINPELQLYTCRFEGSVEHRSGLRLPGIRVGVYEEGTYDSRRPRPMHSVLTDSSGNFVFEFADVLDWAKVEDGIKITSNWHCSDCLSGVWIDLQVHDPSGSYATITPSERIYMHANAYSGLVGHDQCNGRTFEFTME